MSLAAAGAVRTMCPMKCDPTLCGMLAEVRGGELIGVKGDPANPNSRGFLCIRGQASREVIGNPARPSIAFVRDSQRVVTPRSRHVTTFSRRPARVR